MASLVVTGHVEVVQSHPDPTPGFIPSAPNTPAFVPSTFSDDLHLPRLSPAPSHTNLARMRHHDAVSSSTSGGATALSLLALNQADHLTQQLEHVHTTNRANHSEVSSDTLDILMYDYLNLSLTVCDGLSICLSFFLCVYECYHTTHMPQVGRMASSKAVVADVLLPPDSPDGIPVSTSAFLAGGHPPPSPHRPPRSLHLPPSPALPHRTVRSGTNDSDRTPRHALTVDRLRTGVAGSTALPKQVPSSLNDAHVPTFDLEKHGISAPDESDISGLHAIPSHVRAIFV
jgi:hypothetical protein